MEIYLKYLDTDKMRGEVETFLFPVLHWAWPIVHWPNPFHLSSLYILILNKQMFFLLVEKTANQTCEIGERKVLMSSKWGEMALSLDKTNSWKGLAAENRVPLLGWWVVGRLGMGQIIALCCFILEESVMSIDLCEALHWVVPKENNCALSKI